jgi:hypothetical protein
MGLLLPQCWPASPSSVGLFLPQAWVYMSIKCLSISRSNFCVIHAQMFVFFHAQMFVYFTPNVFVPQVFLFSLKWWSSSPSNGGHLLPQMVVIFSLSGWQQQSSGLVKCCWLQRLMQPGGWVQITPVLLSSQTYTIPPPVACQTCPVPQIWSSRIWASSTRPIAKSGPGSWCQLRWAKVKGCCAVMLDGPRPQVDICVPQRSHVRLVQFLQVVNDQAISGRQEDVASVLSPPNQLLSNHPAGGKCSPYCEWGWEAKIRSGGVESLSQQLVPLVLCPLLHVGLPKCKVREE